MAFQELYPQAVVRDYGQHQLPWTSRDLIVLHTMVGYLESTDELFHEAAEPGGDHVFSHFGIGGKWGSDAAAGLEGTVYQWGDLAYRSAAQVDGNPYGISIETADNAPQTPAEIEAWTPAQLDAIVSLCAWLCQKYGIPPTQAPDVNPGTKGIAWHQMGGEAWGGHDCPGPVREPQISAVVIPRVASIVNGTPPPPVPTPKPPAGADADRWHDGLPRVSAYAMDHLLHTTNTTPRNDVAVFAEALNTAGCGPVPVQPGQPLAVSPELQAAWDSAEGKSDKGSTDGRVDLPTLTWLAQDFRSVGGVQTFHAVP